MNDLPVVEGISQEQMQKIIDFVQGYPKDIVMILSGIKLFEYGAILRGDYKKSTVQSYMKLNNLLIQIENDPTILESF